MPSDAMANASSSIFNRKDGLLSVGDVASLLNGSWAMISGGILVDKVVVREDNDDDKSMLLPVGTSLSSKSMNLSLMVDRGRRRTLVVVGLDVFVGPAVMMIT